MTQEENGKRKEEKEEEIKTYLKLAIRPMR
jgi:hypothetical protein